MNSGEELKKNLKTFISHLDAIRDTLPMTMYLIHPYNKKATDDFIGFVKNNAKEIEDDNGKKKIVIRTDESELFEKLEHNASISALARKIIPESLFVSLISQYDAFLTRLLKAIYDITPEVLNGSDRNLTFSQLVKMKNIESARKFIIEKEIDTVLRKSHAEQFEYLENLLSIKLRTNLPIWKKFIEITERRNLLVHCDGVVSSYYIKNCELHRCEIKNVKTGDRLGVPPGYFKEAYMCLYEIAVKLTHTLWRKLLPDDLENADIELNGICFSLINTNSLVLADTLLEFSCEQKRHFNNEVYHIYVINRALSKYIQGEKEEAKNILKKTDWSASSNGFQLAFAVLNDQYEVAYSIMRKIGNNGDIDKSDYKQWPLFTEIRKENTFKEIFKEVFDEEYLVLETPLRPMQELINKEIKKDKELKEKTVKKIDSNKEINQKKIQKTKKIYLKN